MTRQATLVRLVADAVVTASLCVLMVAAPVMAQAPVVRNFPAVKPPQKLNEQQKALHALNRFTFGPRPGDVQAVEKMGPRAWFERQLNPQNIDDSALDAMLLNFPAMQLSTEALLQKFPSPLMLRQMAARGAMPSDPVARAIYASALATYEVNKGGDPAETAQIKKASKNGVVPGAEGMAGDDVPMQGDIAPAMRAVNDSKKDDRRARREEFTGDTAALVAMPPNQRMAEILAMSGPQLVALRTALKPYQKLAIVQGLSPEQRETLEAIELGTARTVGAEALETRLLRDVYSDRQLEAVMTDFWLNHFSVYAKKNQNEPYLLASYERDTIRPRALGKFEDLLVATAESPAMLMYLDNWQSIGPDSLAAERGKRFSQFAPNSQLAQAMPKGINENYARELIELHTVGVRCEVSADHTVKQLEPSCGSGYTQADVTNVAKVLTGWTIDRPYQGGGGFIFDERRHEGRSKQVLGQTIHEGGQKEGLEVLHVLATSPATAQFISHKLAVRFVSDDPPKVLEDRMAKTFLATGGDIKAVLRTMFDAPEFWAPSVYRAKVKTPIEFVASALRTSDATVNNALPLVQAMDRLGMPLYGMQTPNGYSWMAPEWVSTTALVSRMNFALVMSGDMLPGTRTDWPKLLGDADAGSAAVPSLKTEQQLEMLLLGQPAADRTTTAVMEQADKPGQVQEAKQNLAIEAGDDAVLAGKGKGRRALAGGGISMADLASNTGSDGAVTTMAGLLLGSPDFQRR